MSDQTAFPPAGATPARRGGAASASLALVAGTVLLGAAAGAFWGAAAPRPLLVMTGRGAAGLVNAETNAFVAADGVFCLICLVGGVVTGALGYAFAVRRHGPLPMAAVVAGAVAAAFVTRWVGEQFGLATYRHLLATLPAGAMLSGPLTLGAGGALAFWPLAASTVAGGLTVLRRPPRERAARHRARDANGPAGNPGAP